MNCPFCGSDPFHRTDMGEPVAVTCCDLGDLYFRGARPPIVDDVVLDPDEFREIGNELALLRANAAAYAAIVHGETVPLPADIEHARAMHLVATKYLEDHKTD